MAFIYGREILCTSSMGYPEGQKAEYDRFWDAYQKNGSAVDYRGAFGGARWTLDIFKPKYDIKPVTAGNMFWANLMEVDLAELLSELGVVLDFSDASNVNSLFSYAYFTRLGELDLRKATSASSVFASMSKLVTIDKIITSEKTPFTAWFNDCAVLENVVFEGIIAKNGLNLQWSTNLSKASITSVIKALSTTTSGLAVTLSKTAVETAFGSTTSAEWTSLIGTRSNWTITLV